MCLDGWWLVNTLALCAVLLMRVPVLQLPNGADVDGFGQMPSSEEEEEG